MPKLSNKTEKNQKPELSERAERLLKTLIEKYIEEGQPVGSKALVKESGLDLSAATIRSVMSDLEKLGFLHAPHTSAGRVPTDKGYRLFVDSLVHMEPLDQAVASGMKNTLTTETTGKAVLTKASNILSELTNMTGLIMLPRREKQILGHIEFVPLSDNRVLTITVIGGYEVENRIIHTNRPYNKDELQKAANFLNSRYAGKEVQNIRSELLSDLNQARQDMNDLMSVMVEVADKLFNDENDALLVSGEANLLGFQDMADTERLKQLFDAFKQKNDILHLLDQCSMAKGIQIYIGGETGKHALDSCSIITSPYESNGETVGVLGVIGPRRMEYKKVIPMVDITAKILGAALQSK